VSKRPSWTGKQRAEIFRDAEGICHLCTRPIETWQQWHVEHPKARGFKGSDKQEDMRPAHVDCHQVKTKAENKIMRKADAQMKAHFGTKVKSKQTIPVRKALKTIKEKGSSHQAYLQRMAEKGKPVPQRRAT
jgi:5-methylcytosine-specific restriction protein A